LTETPESLAARCLDMRDGAGEAVAWVTEVRGNSQRLDRDADGLIEKLRRTRNLCRRLGTAARRPVSVGVFGMSQAGKSYLISSLARAADGQLHTLLDGKRLNFISHFNPPGGGKEATGLVTRFTRKSAETPAGFPVELTLFSEADLVKVIGNSFFNDFDPQRVTLNTDEDHIRERLSASRKRRQPNPTDGLSEDDMVDLLDYFSKRFERSMAPLQADYWPAAVELAPRLAPADRAHLLAVLWGEIPEFTETYLRLRDLLAGLSHARVVHVPLEALVMEADDGFAWRADSVLNVDVLNHLGRDGYAPLPVVPVTEEGIGAPVQIPRAMLAVLTAEMKFVLADPPLAGFLEEVDLLDFPGYRGRLGVGGMDEVRREVKRDDVDPVAQLLLRGKVAYLFEAYTEDQEMNVLLMCTRCDQQIEVTTLAQPLTAWVHSTQGETPEIRAERLPGLLWVITQLDLRLRAKPGQTHTQLQQEWTNMIHITLQERFSKCDWLGEWATGKAFDNTFLVRKPGMDRSLFALDDDGRELGLLSEAERTRLESQRAIFLGNEAVRRHVREPEEAWDAVLGINDGGMRRLAEFLRGVAVQDAKLERIAEQLARTGAEIRVHRLGPYFQAEGADAVLRKRALGERVSAAVEERADSFGELLFALQPSGEQMRRLYLRSDEPPAAAPAAGAQRASPQPARRRLINLPGKATPDASGPAPAPGRADSFARSITSTWVKQLRDLPDDDNRRRLVELPSDMLQAICDELITAADRDGLEERLVETLAPLEEKRSTTRLGIVDQQVLQARNLINEFVDYLGLAGVPLGERPESPLGRERRLFEPPLPVAAGVLPGLPPQEVPYSGTYVLDWLAAFRALAVANAGHSAGREITAEQNLRLGEILRRFGGRPSAPART